MKFSLATVVSLAVAGSGFVSAAPSEAVTNSNDTTAAAPYGINLGQTFNNVVAWVDGQSKCNYAVVAAVRLPICSPVPQRIKYLFSCSVIPTHATYRSTSTGTRSRFRGAEDPCGSLREAATASGPTVVHSARGMHAVFTQLIIVSNLWAFVVSLVKICN